MKQLTGKKFCKIPESYGWELKRITGSHHIYARVGDTVQISVPVHGNTLLKIGLQKYRVK